MGTLEASPLPETFLISAVGDPLISPGELVPSLHVAAEHGAVDDVSCGRPAAREDDDVLPLGNELAIGPSKQASRPGDQGGGVIGVSHGDEFDAGRVRSFRGPGRCDLHGPDSPVLGVAKDESITDPRTPKEISSRVEDVGVGRARSQPLHADEIRPFDGSEFIEGGWQGAEWEW